MNIYEAIALEPRIVGVLKNQFPVNFEDKESLSEWLKEVHVHINDAYAALHTGTLEKNVVEVVMQAIHNIEENAYLVGKFLKKGDTDEQLVTYH